MYIRHFYQAHGIDSIDNYNAFNRNLTWSSKNNKVSQQKLFLDATYDFEDIVGEIVIRFIKSAHRNSMPWKASKLWAGNSMAWTALNATKEFDIVEQRHRKFGRCYTYHPDTRIKELGIYYIRWKL